MARFLKNISAAAGKAPGSAIFIGKKKIDEIEINLFDYCDSEYHEKRIEDIESIKNYKDSDTVTWINVFGLHDTEKISQLTAAFGLHPLTRESILNSGARPQVENHEYYLHYNLKMMQFNPKTREVESEQISIIQSDKFVLSFQERHGDVFDKLRSRIRNKKGRVRKKGTDYLTYILMDTIVENYLILLSEVGELIEDIENDIINETSKEVLEKIYQYKQEINYLGKVIRPVRDLAIKVGRFESELINDFSRPFFNDLLYLATQAVETTDVYREMLSDHLAFYDSKVNSKLNEIMRVLTIFSVVFIPLTFIAGIYGTNFEYLPELKYKYSYFIFWGVMIVIATSMIGIFKKKKWM